MDEEEERALREFEESKFELEQTIGRITKDTYRAIGSAITIWSQMEGSLVHIASWLLDARSHKVGLVFYSINNFHTWLSIIDELFEIDPAFTPLKSDWTQIANKLRGLNDIRVRLAHHALEQGRDAVEVADNELDFLEAFPALSRTRLTFALNGKRRRLE
jgi:hypothetical protein